MASTPPTRLVATSLEPAAVRASVLGGVGRTVGDGDDRTRTVALTSLEVGPSVAEAVATLVTLPAVTSAAVIVFLVAAGMSVVAAIASALRGGKYVHEEAPAPAKDLATD